MHIDKNGHSNCSQSDLKIAYRYRILLYQSHVYAQHLIDLQVVIPLLLLLLFFH